MIEFLIFSSLFTTVIHSATYTPPLVFQGVQEDRDNLLCGPSQHWQALLTRGSKQRSPIHPLEVVLSPYSCKQALLPNLLKFFALYILREVVLFGLKHPLLFLTTKWFKTKQNKTKLSTFPNSRSHPMLLALPPKKVISQNWSYSTPSLLPIPSSTVQYHFIPTTSRNECTFLRVT